ncbi:MAG: serine hydrolase [Rhodobacteraceae bacterium]|nr:serine hydrolase [Paracoccaceae bacterium]
MTASRILRVLGIGLGVLLLLALAAFLWLRQTPAWAGITLFSEGTRVENFRQMERVFPARPVPSGGDVWAFGSRPAPLPARYEFEGTPRDLAAFLDRTETTGLLVVHRGDIVHEEYRLGADAASRFTSWSMAKSVLSALIGIALEEGRIASLRDPIATYVPALEGTPYGAVPIEDALTMSSGIAFDEDYANPLSDINMLFIRAMAMGRSAEEMLAGLEAEREPGVFNAYASSDSMALGLVLEGATGMAVSDYLAARIWSPMGAEADANWSTDRAGREFSLCCLNATLRDYARFGRLYLEGGARDGRQIVPADWVAASVAPEAPHLQPGDNPASDWTFGYGYKWWIPEEPQGDFVAIGVWGQYIYVDPAREIIIVKTSADPEFDDNDHESIAAFRAIARAVGGQKGAGGTE